MGLIHSLVLILMRRLKFRQERYAMTKTILKESGISYQTAPIFPILSAFIHRPFDFVNELRMSMENSGGLLVSIESYGAHKRPRFHVTRVMGRPIWFFRAVHLYIKGVSIAVWLHRNLHPCLVFVFNARFPLEAGVLAAFSRRGTKILQFDGGSLSEANFNRIQFFEVSPHNHDEIKSKVESYWQQGLSQKLSLAIEQMTSLISGQRSFGSTFLWSPEGLGPSTTFNKGDRYALFFGSSDWESAAFRFSNGPTGFTSQFDACSALASSLQKRGIKLYVKPHPMRKNFSRLGEVTETSKWKRIAIEYDNIHLLSSRLSSAETINLMQGATVVAGYRTSMTAQSIFLGLPTIVLYRSAWINEKNDRNLAQSKGEIEYWLNEYEVKRVVEIQSERESVLPWAYYSRFAGCDLGEVEFSGADVRIGSHQIDKRRFHTFTK